MTQMPAALATEQKARHLGSDGKEKFRVELSDPTSFNKAETFLRKWQMKQ
jgi:hypothetical protein